jgi:DNA helicase-2/ATP-dependent DNA helicase PcrA
MTTGNATLLDYAQFTDRYKIQANEQQEQAIRQVDGPVLLLAVPGSGKTTVIVARTGYMKLCCGIDYDSILTLTFTRAAAQEMRDRFIKKFNVDSEEAKKLHFSTIHSFCVSVLLKAAREYGETIPELEPDNARIIRKVYRDICSGYAQENTVKSIGAAITYAKNMLLDEKSLNSVGKIDAEGDLSFPLIYRKYEQELASNKKMDYDDQLRLAYSLLKKYPGLLDWCQEKFKYISVDEAQDTSYIQHKIIGLLSSKYKNLFMVGDEDQSIYGFRAAYPSALLNFGSEYPGARILYMETNYRSTKAIVDSAAVFIEQNDGRYPKKMKTDNEQGAVIEHTSLLSADYQYGYLLKKLQELQDKPDWTAAVLYRNNESAIPLANLLYAADIRFRYRDDGGKAFFSHPVVTDMLSLLALAQNGRDLNAFMNVYYKLGAYLTKDEANGVSVLMQDDPDSIIKILQKRCVNAKKHAALRQIEQDLERLKGKPPYTALKDIVYAVGYIGWARRSDGGGSAQSALNKIGVLLAIANQCKTIPEFEERIKYLAEQKNSNKSANITLATIHASKGLEFDQVFILDAQEGILPFSSGEDEDIEEEARLFYVGVTRAKKELEILSAKMRMEESALPSRFIKRLLAPETTKKDYGKIALGDIGEIGGLKIGALKPKALKREQALDTGLAEAYVPGCQVEHVTFGRGRVKSVELDRITVSFGFNEDRAFLFPACVEKNLLKLA